MRFVRSSGTGVSVKGEGATLSFPRLDRATNRYRNGVDFRMNLIASQYGLDQIQYRQGDVVVDVGANYGDVVRFFQHREINLDIRAIEPNPVESQYLRHNYPQATVLTVAVGERPGTLDFYLAESGGDSSLIPRHHGQEFIQVKVVTLDDAMEKVPLIKVLKIDAEGAEPEVLRGAEKTLSKTCFVAVDAGFERGESQSSTIAEVDFLLGKNGFSKIHEDKIRVHTCLYENRTLVERVN